MFERKNTFPNHASKMMSLRVLFSFLCLLLLLSLGFFSVFALEWSEIMFNPIGSDNGGEYVELQGIESLEGCTVSDASSTDKLTLLQAGDLTKGVIVIVENDTLLLNEFMAHGATVYTAGSAIGNGLGNTNETVSIHCVMPNASQNLLLYTSYAVNAINGLKEGLSIKYDVANQQWVAGAMNGTPGVLDIISDEVGNISGDQNSSQGNNSTNVNSTNVNGSINSSAMNISNISNICSDILRLFVSKSVITVGDAVIITVLSPGYAEIEAKDFEENVLLFKDNLEGNVFAVSAPNTSQIKITARAKLCDSEQRMVRVVMVKKPLVVLEEHSSQTLLKTNNGVNAVKRNTSAGLLNNSSNISNISTTQMNMQNTTAVLAIDDPSTDNSKIESPYIASQATGAVSSKFVYDANANIIPWISLFGVVTILSCTVIFFMLYKNKQI